jgi:chromosome segregation ATPase
LICLASYQAYHSGSQDMDDVKNSLHRVKQDNHKLESELRGTRTEPWRDLPAYRRAATATVEQKARILHVKVTENADVLDKLRQERSMLQKDHKQLQQKYTNVNEASPTRIPKRGFLH